MIKVNNREVIRRLAFRDLRSDKKMNFVVIISIVLTCILFTALTAVGGSLVNGFQQEQIRKSGSKTMASYKYVLPEDCEKVKADKAVSDVSYRVIVGEMRSEKLKNIKAEIDCAENELQAENCFCAPTVGKLPEEIDDIAVSTVVLDELELPYELGTVLSVGVDIDGKLISRDFKLSGYWEGDMASMAQVCWVSKVFADEYAPTPTEKFEYYKTTNYAGYYNVDFNFKNSWDIEGKMYDLTKRLYGSVDNAPVAGVNVGYITSTVDGGMVTGGIVMLLLVFSAGYLMIYNIFHINISANIRSYGLLKTIGTTAKQLKRMVRIRAAVYSAAGIPVGLAIGLFIGKVLFKSIVKTLNIHVSSADYNVSIGLTVIVCIFSALFTFVTVMISCRKPCRIAAGVSPVEALRYNETDINITEKETGKITPRLLAKSNMSRSRKKTAVVVMSLTLSLVLVNTLFTVLNGIDKDKFLSDSIVGDINIRHADNSDVWDDLTKGITPEMLSKFEQINGAEVHPVYYETGVVYPEGEYIERLKKIFSGFEAESYLKPYVDKALAGEYDACVYGVDEAVLEQFSPTEGDIDIEKFMQGGYAIVYTYINFLENAEECQVYRKGDKITVGHGDEKREYEVLTVCKLPYPLSIKMYNIIQTEVIIPTDEYMTLTDNRNAESIMINTSDKSGRVEEMCEAACEREPLSYSDKQTQLDAFSDFIRMIKLVGGTLSVILALIGILNFINAEVTGMISRKKELAMMNAVGMTGRQINSMLRWEGIRYALLTAVSAAVTGSVFSLFAVRSFASDMAFYRYHFTLMPILCCVPVLIILALIVPHFAYRSISRESVIERLREN